jgi:hypothetical protein
MVSEETTLPMYRQKNELELIKPDIIEKKRLSANDTRRFRVVR